MNLFTAVLKMRFASADALGPEEGEVEGEGGQGGSEPAGSVYLDGPYAKSSLVAPEGPEAAQVSRQQDRTMEAAIQEEEEGTEHAGAGMEDMAVGDGKAEPAAAVAAAAAAAGAAAPKAQDTTAAASSVGGSTSKCSSLTRYPSTKSAAAAATAAASSYFAGVAGSVSTEGGAVEERVGVVAPRPASAGHHEHREQGLNARSLGRSWSAAPAPGAVPGPLQNSATHNTSNFMVGRDSGSAGGLPGLERGSSGGGSGSGVLQPSRLPPGLVSPRMLMRGGGSLSGLPRGSSPAWDNGLPPALSPIYASRASSVGRVANTRWATTGGEAAEHGSGQGLDVEQQPGNPSGQGTLRRISSMQSLTPRAAGSRRRRQLRSLTAMLLQSVSSQMSRLGSQRPDSLGPANSHDLDTLIDAYHQQRSMKRIGSLKVAHSMQAQGSLAQGVALDHTGSMAAPGLMNSTQSIQFQKSSSQLRSMYCESARAASPPLASQPAFYKPSESGTLQSAGENPPGSNGGYWAPAGGSGRRGTLGAAAAGAVNTGPKYSISPSEFDLFLQGLGKGAQTATTGGSEAGTDATPAAFVKLSLPKRLWLRLQFR